MLLTKSTAAKRWFFIEGYSGTAVVVGGSLTLAPVGQTGLTIAVKIAKDTATSFSNPNAGATNLTEVANGWYYVSLDTTDTNTAGQLRFQLTWGSGNSYGEADNVVACDLTDAVRLGLSSLANASAGASGGLLISGSNSGTTTFGAVTCTGSFTVSDGLLVSRSTSNTSAITATGNGTGSGMVCTSGSGATGDGFQATAASTNGNGMTLAGIGTGPGLKATGGATGNAVTWVGGATSGDGLNITTTSGHGIGSTAAGASKYGLFATGASHGMLVQGGANSTGLSIVGGSGTGVGLKITVGGTAAGVSITGGSASGATAAGAGILIVGGTASTSSGGTAAPGIKATGGAGAASTNGAGEGMTLAGGGTTTVAGANGLSATGTGNLNGVSWAGAGSGSGELTTGGATGPAVQWTGGATSGDGLKVTVVSGHGFNVVATGTAMDALHLVGAAASSGNAAGSGINAAGGAASTSAGGTSGAGVAVTGGAGASSTNGSAAGATFAGGGTTTVAGANGVTMTGTKLGHGLDLESGTGATGNGLNCYSNATNGSGLTATGSGSGEGIYGIGGSSNGSGMYVSGGGSTGSGLTVQSASDALVVASTGGHGVNISASGTSHHGMLITGGSAGTSDGLKCVAGTGGVDIRGNITGTLTAVTTATNLTTNNDKTGYSLSQAFPTNFSSLAIDASGRMDVGKTLGTAVTLDSNNVLNVSAKYLAGTALTGRDVGASVLLSAGTGTGQIDFTSGVVKANATQWLGGAIPAVNVTGVPLVDLKYTLGTISAGAAGYTAPDWGHVNASTTTVNLSGTTIATTQRVDVNTIKTQAVTCSGGVTVPAATLASTTNITAGTITSVGNVSGNVAGNVGGYVGSVAAAVTLSTVDSQVILTGLASAVGGTNALNTQTSLGANDLPNGCLVKLLSGTGAGQCRSIVAYDNGTQVLTVDRDWVVAPDNTTVFAILYDDAPALLANLEVATADPWATALPGGYTAGQAGYLLGGNLGAVASVTGDVGGRVLGGGSSAITDVGVWSEVRRWYGQTAPALRPSGWLGVDVMSVYDDQPAALNMYAYFTGLIKGAADPLTFTPTTTAFETYFTTDKDFFTDQIIVWTNGSNIGLHSRVSSYVFTGNNKVKLTVDAALPNAANGAFQVVGRLEASSTGDTPGTTTLLSRVPGTVQPQTGDSYARLGAPAGASVSVDVAAVNAKTTNLPAVPASTTNITAGTITTVTNLTTNNDKTGYSLTQSFPTNFAALGISGSGHVSNVDVLTTYTGNTVQTGDAYARIGAAGAGLTALGDSRVAHLDADVSSRMATYAQPTGFLAATFPASVASPTNITAGTITTATNLTNLPSIPANWLTAAGIAAGALNGKGDWLLASGYTAPDNADVAAILADCTTLLSRITAAVATNADMQTAIADLNTLLSRVSAAAALAGTAPSWWVVPPTAAQNATAVLTDTTAGDFAVGGSPGKVLVTQLGGALAGSVFTAPALANAPTGGGDPLAAVVPGSYAQGTAGFALGKLGPAQITVSSVVGQNGSFVAVQGFDYFAGDGRAFDFTDASAAWPDLTGAAVTLSGVGGWTHAMSIVTAGGATQKVRLELTAADTLVIPAGSYRVAAVLANAHRVELLALSVSVAQS